MSNATLNSKSFRAEPAGSELLRLLASLYAMTPLAIFLRAVQRR